MINSYQQMLSIGVVDFRAKDGKMHKRNLLSSASGQLAIVMPLEASEPFFFNLAHSVVDPATGWRHYREIDITDMAILLFPVEELSDIYVNRGSIPNATTKVHRLIYRMIVDRFLSVYPSSNKRYRMAALREFLNSGAFRGNPYAPSAAERIGKVLNSTRDILPLGRRWFHYDSFRRTSDFVKREHRINERERNYLRTSSKRNEFSYTQLRSLVSAYHSNCCTLSNTSHSRYHEGWTYLWDSKEIVFYSKYGEKKKIISLAGLPVPVGSRKLVSVTHLRNTFCAVIEEETEDTMCLSVLNKSLSFIGYVCLSKTNHAGFIMNHDASESANQPVLVRLERRLADMISVNKARAYARLLAET